jgi:hypothetical protein
MPEDPLDVGQGQVRVADHPLRGGMPQIVQCPVRAQRGVGLVEDHPGGVVCQRPERTAQSPPQCLLRPFRDQVPRLLLVEPQPHERVGRGRQPLQRPAALADHTDHLLLGHHEALADAEQFGGAGAGGHVERDQGPIPVAVQGREELAERLIRDAPRGWLGLLRLIHRSPRWPPERPHRIVVGVEMLVDAPGLGERVDQRPAVHLPVVLIERPDHRASVPPGPGRVVGARSCLASDRVHRSRCRRVRAALPQRLLAGLEPQSEVARLRASGEMPGNLHRTQKPVPRQQFVGV